MNDVEAERALLGDMLTLPDRIPEIQNLVVPADFTTPTYGQVFTAAVELYEQGVRPDFVTLRDRLSEVADRDIFDLLSAGSGGWKRYGQIVARHALSRKVAVICEDGRLAAMAGVDPAEVLEQVTERLGSVDRLVTDSPVVSLDAFMDRAEDERRPWVIPGLLRVGNRAVIIAEEGVGKAVLLRQMAMLVGQGIHPFAFTPIPPTRTLIVDYENDEISVNGTCRLIRAHLQQRGTYVPGMCAIEHREQGVNLRARKDRSALEAVLAKHRPGLVCLGPLYKSARRDGREDDESFGKAVADVFDDLRIRYGFALVLEHHAPKGSGPVRDLVPFGSSLWLRWPEFGIKLVPPARGGVQSFSLGRFRGDRVQAAWPDRIDRGLPFPWVGVWDDPRVLNP